MKKILYILRHGETNENKIGIVQGQGIDSSLNELGLWQASQFFKKYKNRSFDQIIASGQKRSYQTIEAFESNHQRIHRDIRINEISWGEHEGKAGEPDLMIKYYKILDAWKSGDFDASPISGESASKLYERINEFINDIQVNPYQQILVCTHGRTLRALVCRLLQLPLSQMENVKQNNTGLYIFEYEHLHWKMIQENDLSHLTIDAEN